MNRTLDFRTLKRTCDCRVRRSIYLFTDPSDNLDSSEISVIARIICTYYVNSVITRYRISGTYVSTNNAYEIKSRL